MPPPVKRYRLSNWPLSGARYFPPSVNRARWRTFSSTRRFTTNWRQKRSPGCFSRKPARRNKSVTPLRLHGRHSCAEVYWLDVARQQARKGPQAPGATQPRPPGRKQPPAVLAEVTQLGARWQRPLAGGRGATGARDPSAKRADYLCAWDSAPRARSAEAPPRRSH